MNDTPAILLCGRGPRTSAADAALQAMRGGLAARLPGSKIETAYAHGADRSIHDGLLALSQAGARTMVCMPAMLFAGAEIKSSLTAAINDFAAAHPETTVVCGRDPAIDPKMLRAAKARLDPVLAAGGVAVEDTLMVFAGPGGVDADGNADVAKVARMVWEGIGAGWTEVCYIGDASPNIDDSLAHAARLGFKRIVVLPYLLVADARIAALQAAAEAAMQKHPDLPVAVAEAIGVDDMVLDTIAERIGMALDGGTANAMNCQLCSFREQVLGSDHGHHHHDHDHDHHHHHHDEPAG